MLDITQFQLKMALYGLYNQDFQSSASQVLGTHCLFCYFTFEIHQQLALHRIAVKNKNVFVEDSGLTSSLAVLKKFQPR